MAEYNDPASELPDDPTLTPWEISCFEDFDKTFVSEERRIKAETEKTTERLWLSFQNSASSVSQLYKDGLQSDGVSLWIPFQSAAGCVTTLYKDSQELIKRSFELGNQLGHKRRSKEFLSWLRKYRRTFQRDDFVALICEKPLPSAVRSRQHSRGQAGGNRRTVDFSSPRYLVPSPVREYAAAETDFAPFKDSLALQELTGSVANTTAGRRLLPSNPHLVGSNERFVSVVTADDLPGAQNSRKRFKSGDRSSPDSFGQKRPRVCSMETEEDL